jgi:hypothetical protein
MKEVSKLSCRPVKLFLIPLIKLEILTKNETKNERFL